MDLNLLDILFKLEDFEELINNFYEDFSHYFNSNLSTHISTHPLVFNKLIQLSQKNVEMKTKSFEFIQDIKEKLKGLQISSKYFLINFR
mgnify:CR=1 FL=1